MTDLPVSDTEVSRGVSEEEQEASGLKSSEEVPAETVISLTAEGRTWADDADEFFDGYDQEVDGSDSAAPVRPENSSDEIEGSALVAERVESGKDASSSDRDVRGQRPGSSKRTLDSILETVEEVKRKPSRPNDVLKKIFAWTSSKMYRAKRLSKKGLAALTLNECTFQFLEEEAGLTIDKYGKLQPSGKAIKIAELVEQPEGEIDLRTMRSEESLFILKDVTDEEFVEVLGASFGVSGSQAMRMPPGKRLRTDRLLDELVHNVASALPEQEQRFADFMKIRQEAVLVKATLAEVLSAGIKECMNSLDNRLLLFSGSLGEVRTAKPINCIMLSFKCEGHIPRRTNAKDKIVKRLSIDDKDFLCRMNIGVRSLFGGKVRSLLEVVVEMEVNLTQTRILSFYCSCRNSVGSINASMEEIMMIQDEAFDLIITEDLLDRMDDEEDYELANFSELMGIMVLAGVRPYFACEGVFSAMWNKCLYAVMKNLSEFKSCFSSAGCKKHFVDSLSFFYLIEPLIDNDKDKKTLLINIMLWAIFLDEATLISSYQKSEKWRSEMQISGMILWIIACLYEYDEVCSIDYKFLPIILVHNYCITGKWAISVYNMSQWLASVVTLNSDNHDNNSFMLSLLSKMGLEATDEERIELEIGANLMEKTQTIIKILTRASQLLGVDARMKKRSRKETITLMYHIMSLICKGHPYYAYTEKDLAGSDVNNMIGDRFKAKVDCGEIDVTDYQTVIAELLLEAETGYDIALDGIPGCEDSRELLMMLECSRMSKQSGGLDLPSDEVIGAITSEGLELSEAQVGIIRSRAMQMSKAVSSDGRRIDEVIAAKGMMSRVLSSAGTVVTRDMFQLKGKQVQTRVGFARDGNVESAGLSLTIGDDPVFVGSSTIIEGLNKPEFAELLAKHRLSILGGIRIESNCLFSIDTAEIKRVLKNIASTKSAISQDVRHCLASNQAKQKQGSRLITNVSIEEFVPFIFNGSEGTSVNNAIEINDDDNVNYVVNKFKMLAIDIYETYRRDLTLFDSSAALSEINTPLLIVIIPLNLINFLILIHVFVLDTAWDIVSNLHELIVEIQERSMFPSAKWSDGLGFKTLSNIFFGGSVLISSLWLSGVRAAVSSTLGFALVTVDGLKEKTKELYLDITEDIRIRGLKTIDSFENRTGLTLMSSNERKSADFLVDSQYETRGSLYEVSSMAKIASFFNMVVIIPYRITLCLYRSAKNVIELTYVSLKKKISDVRSKISSKLSALADRMRNVKKQDERSRRGKEVIVGESDLELGNVEAAESSSKNDQVATSPEAEVVTKPTSTDQRKKKNKKKKDTDEAKTSDSSDSSLVKCGIKVGVSTYLAEKLAKIGFEAAMNTIRRNMAVKEDNVLTQIPDDSDYCSVEGAQLADVDFVSYLYINKFIKELDSASSGLGANCGNLAGVTLIGDACIVHKQFKPKHYLQGGGKLTMCNFGSFNCFFLYNQMLQINETQTIKYDIHDSSSIFTASYSAREFLSLGCDNRQATIIGRVSLLIDNKDEAEYIVTASHMVPYGKICREFDSYDSIDVLCSNWVFKPKTRDVNESDLDADSGLEKSEDKKKKLNPIVSEFFIGDNSSDYLMFICKNGDYRGHSGGLILDRKNRPIAICVMQLKINNSLSLDDDKSIVIGCKLDNLSAKVFGVSSKRILLCNNCCTIESDRNEVGSSINVTVDMGKLIFSDCPKPSTEIFYCKNIDGEFVKTGLLEELCELNKNKEIGVFLEKHSRSNILMRLLEIIYDETTKDFDEPSSWIVKTVFESVVESKVLLLIICSNMLSLSVCTLLTCVGVQFKRVKNLFSIEAICRDNVSERINDLVIINIDDLLIDLIKIRTMHRNFFRDRCKTFILSRTSSNDNALDKLAVRISVLLGNRVKVKAWPLEVALNIQSSKKMLSCNSLKYSQNSGHYRVFEMWTKYEKGEQLDSEKSLAGRMVILTSASTKSSQEAIMSKMSAEIKLVKSNVTVVNFASLSSEAVCESLMAAESLCLTSWTSGELTAGIYYNVQLDTVSDGLELLMIEQSINFKLDSLKIGNKRLYLNETIRSEYNYVSALADPIIEIKMTKTAKAKQVFLEELNGILENCSFRNRVIYRRWSDPTTDNMIQFETARVQTTYEVEQKSIITEDFLKFSQERRREFRERILDNIEFVYIKIEKIKLKWLLTIRRKILEIKIKIDRFFSVIKMKIKSLKKRVFSFDVVKCRGAMVAEVGSESESFGSCLEDLSSDSENSCGEIKEGKAMLNTAFSAVNGKNIANDAAEMERKLKLDLQSRREKIADKIRRKAGEMAAAFKTRSIKLLHWFLGLPMMVYNTGATIVNSVFKIIGRIISFGKNKKTETITEKCSFSYEEKDEPSMAKRVVKSCLTAIASSKLFNEVGVDASSKMIASFCLDSLLYEVAGCLNKSVQDIYWKVTAVPSIVIAAVESYCFFTNTKIVLNIADIVLQFDGSDIRCTIAVIKNILTIMYDNIKANASVNVNCILPTGLLIKDYGRLSKKNIFSNILELSFKMMELTKRCLFKIGLNSVVIKLWKIITGRSFDTKQPSGVLSAVPCYITTEEVNFFGGLTLLIVGIVRLSIIKTEEKLAMIGVIAEKRHLADNINLYLKDRSEYATMIRIVCCSAIPLYWSKTNKAGKMSLSVSSLAILFDWFFSTSSYGGLSLSLTHIISRTLCASSWAGAFPSALAAWWEDGSSQKIAMNSLVLLGDQEVKTKNKRKNGRKGNVNGKSNNISRLVGALLDEQAKEREGNAALIDQLLSPAEALMKCMMLIRKKKISSRFMFKLMDEDKTNMRDQELYLNIDAVLSNRNTNEQYDTIIKIKDLYRNQCRYLGRLKELPTRKEDSLESKSKQTSVLMVANYLWSNVTDEQSMKHWEAAGDSRSHVLIAISERNDSPVSFNIAGNKIELFCVEMSEMLNNINYKLYDLIVNLNIDIVNWVNVISISNEKSTPGILTRNRTNSRLTASYLPFYRHRVEAMREIILNKDVDEENEIINVFAKRRIEKKKMSNIIGKEVVITRTIQANECDYKTAISDLFNVVDKIIKITRGYTGVSVGMNFFVEFSNDDEINKVVASDLAKTNNMITKRISLDHSSFDSSQRNWSIEAVKEFRKEIVDIYFKTNKRDRIKKFFDSCYDSLKCRVMLTAQGDLFGITGQQMSGHATTSVDNSIKSKCYCAAILPELEKKTGWKVIRDTIRVQGDDTKMEALCESKKRHDGEIVKSVINQEMRSLGQEVKTSKIEIFEGDEASNFLSHYTYDYYLIIASEEGLKRIVAKMPGRNYFDNINSLATTLKASKTKKHRKELGLLAAKSASFLTMYVGDGFLSCACCLVLAYCLNEMKMIRRETGLLTVSKDKLAYLIASNDDIETVSVSFDHIFKLHGFDPTGKNYKVKSWQLGVFEAEREKASNVANLSKNILSLMGGRFDVNLRNQIKEIRDLMERIKNGKIEELEVENLSDLISTGKEALKLKMINVTVAYEPYLSLKRDIRAKSGLVEENSKKRNFIVKNKRIRIEDLILIIEAWLGDNGYNIKYSDKIEYVNESGFLINSLNSSAAILENDVNMVIIANRDIEALALGANIANSINVIIVEDKVAANLRTELGIKVVRRKLFDLNELSASSLGTIARDETVKLKNILESSRTINERRRTIVSIFKTDLKKEFINCFYRT